MQTAVPPNLKLLSKFLFYQRWANWLLTLFTAWFRRQSRAKCTASNESFRPVVCHRWTSSRWCCTATPPSPPRRPAVRFLGLGWGKATSLPNDDELQRLKVGALEKWLLLLPWRTAVASAKWWKLVRFTFKLHSVIWLQKAITPVALLDSSSITSSNLILFNDSSLSLF